MPGSASDRFRLHAKVTLAVVALVPVMLAGACGSDPPPQGQRGPVATSAPGDFDAIPRYPDSEPAGERSQKADTVTRSFVVRNATPQEILDWYGDHLKAWEQFGAIERVGTQDVLGKWRRQDHQLLVSAAPAPTLSTDKTPTVQYSLVLSPL